MAIVKKPVRASKETKAKATKSTKKAAPEIHMTIQYQGRELTQANMLAAVKDAWTAAGNDLTAISSVDLYVKPEDAAVYYVINGTQEGKLPF